MMDNSIKTVNDLSNCNGNKLVHLNVRSVRGKKIDELKLRFDNSNMDFITISESWLTCDDVDNLYKINGFNIYIEMIELGKKA